MFDATAFASLILRVRQGEQEAASELVREYESLIRREVRMRLEDQRLRRVLDSMDVCQSVLASFFVRTALGEYDLEDPRQLVMLLVSMTKNKVASIARRENRMKRDHRRMESGEDPLRAAVSVQPNPSQLVADHELLERVRELLSNEESHIASLRGQGLQWDQIADQLGGTAQSRRMQFTRALERVRVQLGLDEDSDE